MSAQAYLLALARREADLRYRQAAAWPQIAKWLAYLDVEGCSVATLVNYEKGAKRLLNMFPENRLEDFTPEQLTLSVAAAPQRSRQVYRAQYSSLFKWAYVHSEISANPVDLIPRVRRRKPEVREVFSDVECAALCALPVRDGALMRVLLDTGLRKAEACGLMWKRCSLDTQMLIVKEGAKGSRDRVIPLEPELLAALADLATLEGLKPDDHLWYTRPGGAVALRRSGACGVHTFDRWWRSCLDQAGVGYRNPHTARHTFATRLRRRGMAIDDLQALMGHASIETTSSIYVHTKMSEVAVRMKALPAL